MLTSAEFAYDYVVVLINNQQGGFTQTLIPTNLAPIGIAMADLNGDGNLDVVVQASAAAEAGVFLGDGTGRIKQTKQTVSYPTINTQPPTIADVNGDGIPDLLLPADGTLGVAYGIGNGTFQPMVGWGLSGGQGQILVENLHGQAASANLPDIVSPDDGGGITILLNVTK